MTTIIEPATDGHLAQCERLLSDAHSVMFPGRPPGERASFGSLIDGEDVYVARRTRSVDGFISLWRPDAFIHFLIVDAAHRGHGIGTALLAFALAELPFPVRLKCGLGNTAAQAFYTARGARVVETVEGTSEPYILYAFDAPVQVRAPD